MRTPEGAPPRDDLPWLRRRTLRTAAVDLRAPMPVPAPLAPAPAAKAQPADTSLDLSPARPTTPAPSAAPAPSADPAPPAT
jgi:hypothetical protein